jgi:hypothetical protein
MAHKPIHVSEQQTKFTVQRSIELKCSCILCVRVDTLISPSLLPFRKGLFYFHHKISLLTKDATPTVKVKAVSLSPVQYHYPIPMYRHARSLQMSVFKLTSRYNWAVSRIQTAVDGVSLDYRTVNLT